MATSPQPIEQHDPILVSGVVGMSSKESLRLSAHASPLTDMEHHDYFLTHLSQEELDSLGKIAEINPSIVGGLYQAINRSRTEGVHFMPWVKKILGEYGSVQVNIPNFQDEYLSRYQSLAIELLGVFCDSGKGEADKAELEELKTFVIRGLGAFHRTFAELSFLSGNQESLQRLRNDVLYRELFLVDAPLQFLEDEEKYPGYAIAHNMIAISQVVHGLFLQAESGVSPEALEQQLQKYYQNFSFDQATTKNYTEHDELVSTCCLELLRVYQEHPLPPGAKICVVGCGQDPVELKIFAKLKEKGLLPDDCIIEMLDMQTSEHLGLDYSSPDENELARKGEKVGLDIKFYPGTRLSDWSESKKNTYHTVTLIGSVLNNDPNQLHWLSDFVALKRLLKPGEGSSLIVDTANLENLAMQNPHYQAWTKYHQENPAAPVGSRRSAHMDAYAQIFPSYYFRAINALLGFRHSEPVIWDAGGKYRSLWIEENTSQEITPLARTVLKIMTSAYSNNTHPQSPSPVSEETALFLRGRDVELELH